MDFQASVEDNHVKEFSFESITIAIYVLIATIPSLFQGKRRSSSKIILMILSLFLYFVLTQFGTKEVRGSQVFLLDSFSLVIGYIWRSILLMFVSRLPPLLRGDVGPFGKDASKISTLIAVFTLKPMCLSITFNRDENISSDNIKILLIVTIIICVATTIVLELWSRIMKSTGRHEGISNLARLSKNQGLSPSVIATTAALAAGNALCEEAEFRGLFMSELEAVGWSISVSNIIQSISFGIAHWHGVPSGATGVFLTFVYGIVMGLMRTYGNGILIPVLCHAIADFFIFTVIARKTFDHTD